MTLDPFPERTMPIIPLLVGLLLCAYSAQVFFADTLPASRRIPALLLTVAAMALFFLANPHANDLTYRNLIDHRSGHFDLVRAGAVAIAVTAATILTFGFRHARTPVIGVLLFGAAFAIIPLLHTMTLDQDNRPYLLVAMVLLPVVLACLLPRRLSFRRAFVMLGVAVSILLVKSVSLLPDVNGWLDAAALGGVSALLVYCTWGFLNSNWLRATERPDQDRNPLLDAIGALVLELFFIYIFLSTPLCAL
jgi:hypothetical protein